MDKLGFHNKTAHHRQRDEHSHADVLAGETTGILVVPSYAY